MNLKERFKAFQKMSPQAKKKELDRLRELELRRERMREEEHEAGMDCQELTDRGY